MGIEISLLGAVEASSGGHRVELGPPQQRALLALLALRNGAVVPVSAIVDALWPDDPPASAAKVVQTYVSRLRKSLGEEAIERRGSGYALNRACASVDAAQFEELVQTGRVPEALALWRGPALADVSSPPALRHEAERLEELRVRAVEERVDAELEAGKAEQVVGDLQALVAGHPLRERLVGRLMQALYAAGRQAEALEVYRAARRTLVDELGIEPGPELKELERRILEQDPTLGPVATERAAAVPVAEGGRHRRSRRARVWLIVAGATIAAAAAAAVVLAVDDGGGSKAVVPVANSVIRIDPSTNEVVESIPVGREPTGIVATRDAVWVSNERDKTLTRIDTRTHAMETIGGLSGVGFVTRDERGNIYASGWDYPFVWRIDPRKAEVVETFRVRSRAVGMGVGGGSLWVVDRLVNGVTRIDLARPRKRSFVPVGGDPIAGAFGFGSMWVANSDDGTVSVIRPGVVDAQTIDVSEKPYGIAVGEGGVWVGSYQDSTVTRIDPELRRVMKRISITPSEWLSASGLYNVAVGAGSVWAASNDAQDIARIDPRTNKVVAHIKLPVSPRVIAIAGDQVWVSVGAPGTSP
jgi:YVTN family beta-propeller protein